VAARYTPAEAAVKAIKAGVDLIEKSPDIDAAIAGIKEAIKQGEIAEARITASVERLLRAKAALGLHQKKTISLDDVDREVNHPRFLDLAQQIADRSMTLARDEQKLLPLTSANGKLFNLTFTDEDDRAITRTFVEELRARGSDIESYTLDSRATEAEINRVLAKLDSIKADAVIYSVAVRARSGKGSIALPATGKRLAGELFKRRLPLIVISFGNPYLLAAIPDSPSYLLAYSPFPVSQRAAAKAVLGEIEISGKLPVSLPGLYPREHGIKIEKKR
jgi:beta-N-acetylhexosaminidase